MVCYLLLVGFRRSSTVQFLLLFIRENPFPFQSMHDSFRLAMRYFTWGHCLLKTTVTMSPAAGPPDFSLSLVLVSRGDSSAVLPISQVKAYSVYLVLTTTG